VPPRLTEPAVGENLLGVFSFELRLSRLDLMREATLLARRHSPQHAGAPRSRLASTAQIECRPPTFPGELYEP
jgi:hypothetical protein